MCDLSMVLMLGSTLLGAVGQIQQAQAQAAAARHNAKVQEMNAKIARDRARDAIERGAKEEQRKRMEVAKIIGQQKVAYAANNVDLNFGSPLDTVVDTAVLGELDALTIRTNAYREAYDHQVDAANMKAGANLSRAEARAASTGGFLAAAGTVLGGVGEAYKQYRSPLLA